MFKRLLLVVIGLIALLDGAFFVSAQDKAPSDVKKPDPPPMKYEAEEGIPKDKAGEKRRDYAVLEAALNDLTSPKNPEYKNHIRNVGPGQAIVIDEKTSNRTAYKDVGRESRNISHEDPQSISTEIRQDFKRRDVEKDQSLADFKPANPNILVRDLDKVFGDKGDPIGNFQEKYPTAWGYVWAHLPAYSKDGKSVLVVFQGGPNGDHGLDWFYMLTRNGKRWDVQWRHCHRYE